MQVHGDKYSQAALCLQGASQHAWCKPASWPPPCTDITLRSKPTEAGGVTYWVEIIGIQDFTLRLFNGMGKVDFPNDMSDFGVGWQGDVGIPGERGLPGPRGATVSTTLLANQTDTKGATFSNCIVPGDFQQQRNYDPIKGSDSALADSPVQMQSNSFNFLWQRKLKLPKKLVRRDWAVSRSLIKQW